ncbi:MAG: sugar phosphate isomerase/epimerase [Candidatus Omnitrophica bacterium]|nr:sugar phosphate isomerase/epimerase [Candidatus Omnitrophota bacterium]
MNSNDLDQPLFAQNNNLQSPEFSMGDSTVPEPSMVPRRDFLKGSVMAMAGGALGAAAVTTPTVMAETGAAKTSSGKSRMSVGVNLEFVRHADKSLAYGVKAAAKLGFAYVEPCFLMGRCLLSNSGYCHVTSMDTDPTEIKKMVEDAGVKISALSSHSDLLSPEFGVLYARRAIRYAKALGCNIVQITEDMYPPKWLSEQDAYDLMKINLRAIAETCDENGVYLGVEQHGPYTAKIQRMKRILELVDSPWIRVNYDCGNTFLSGEDPYEMLEAVIGKVVHVHAKDISVKQAEAERGKVTGTAVGCACGDGVIDWRRIVGRLKKANFTGVLSVECGTETEAERSLKHLDQVLTDLDA